jgi:hypothetical protein
MQCPTCGYQLSPFDKECPRCQHFEHKRRSFSAPQHQEEAPQTPLPEEQPSPLQTDQQPPLKRRKLSAFDKFARGLAAFMSLIVISIFVAALYNSYAQSGLTGKWVDKAGWNSYQFNSDGTATWDFHPPGMSAFYNLTYTADGNTLTETFSEMNGQPISPEDKYFGHPLTRTYMIEGNELIIKNPDNGMDWTFSRE